MRFVFRIGTLAIAVDGPDDILSPLLPFISSNALLSPDALPDYEIEVARSDGPTSARVIADSDPLRVRVMTEAPGLLDCILAPLGFALSSSHYFLAHGAALASEKRTVLILGVSGAGKSTLAAHLAHAGLKLFSDDMIYFRYGEGGREVLPFPKIPKARGPVPNGQAPTLSIPTEPIILDRSTILFPVYEEGTSLRIVPMETAQAFKAALEKTFSNQIMLIEFMRERELLEVSFKGLSSLVRSSRSYALHYCDKALSQSWVPIMKALFD